MKEKLTYLPGLIIILFFAPHGGAQAQSYDQDSYESEFIWGINKNTSGGLIGGLVARKSRRIGEDLYESFGLELMNVKHPNEVEVRRQGTGNAFILGKSNYLYAIRLQYGRELVLFKKAPRHGVEVKLNAAAGPSIGLVAPYYVEVANNCNGSGGDPYQNTSRVPYTSSVSDGCIVGRGYLLQGIQESDLRIGGNVKASLSFELGTSKNNVTGFEAGMLLDAYAKEIELMPAADNKSVFPTAFITLFYGSRR